MAREGGGLPTGTAIWPALGLASHVCLDSEPPHGGRVALLLDEIISDQILSECRLQPGGSLCEAGGLNFQC